MMLRLLRDKAHHQAILVPAPVEKGRARLGAAELTAVRGDIVPLGAAGDGKGQDEPAG
jgi:hypothetical protein